MNRRDLITLFGGIAVAWPFRARAQQTDRAPVIGLLHSGSPEQNRDRRPPSGRA
jgi:putative ABC transport system substrate-binding protein